MRKDRVEVNLRHKLGNPDRLVPGNVPSYKGENGVKTELGLIFALFFDVV